MKKISSQEEEWETISFFHQLYEDAVEMQMFFIKQRDEICRNGERLLTPALSYQEKHLTAALDTEKQSKLEQEQKEDEDKQSKRDSEERILDSGGVSTMIQGGGGIMI